MYFNINGIPTKDAPEQSFWVAKGPSMFYTNECNYSYGSIGAAAILDEWFGVHIFGSKRAYRAALLHLKPIIMEGGIDSSMKISRNEFEGFAQTLDERSRKLLYYQDVITLLSVLKNSIMEAFHLLGEFYMEFNKAEVISIPEKKYAVVHTSGLLVTRIFSFVNHLFISLYSQLDFLTKICYEAQHLPKDFSSFQKLASAKILFGNAKRLSLFGREGTVFEGHHYIKMIEILRHEIVHNSSIEPDPKIFHCYRNGKLIEKYTLLPDMERGIYTAFGNRKRFYHQQIKLNEVLPLIVSDFFRRVESTLLAIMD